MQQETESTAYVWYVSRKVSLTAVDHDRIQLGNTLTKLNRMSGLYYAQTKQYKFKTN